MSRLQKILQINLILLFSGNVFAAACCGGNSTIPSLITTDDRQTLSASVSHSQIDTDVYTNGVWKKRNDLETFDTYKIDAAFIFEDRYQWGFSLPVVKRAQSGVFGGSSSGIGDVSA